MPTRSFFSATSFTASEISRPNFGETVLPYIEKATDEFLRFPERAVDLLLNEILETIEQPFILVLDDYHHIGRETVVHKLVDRLLQYSSEIIHLIITTRDLPPLAIMRRRTQSRALVITREDLLFTDEEMRELFRQTLNIELKDDEIAEYRKRTDGWITALQLVRQVAEQEIYAHSDSFKLNLGRNSASIGKRHFRLFRRRSFLARIGRNAESFAAFVLARISAARCLLAAFSRYALLRRSAGTRAEKCFSDGRGRRAERAKFIVCIRFFGIFCNVVCVPRSVAPDSKPNATASPNISLPKINGTKLCRIYCKPKILKKRRK